MFVEEVCVDPWMCASREETTLERKWHGHGVTFQKGVTLDERVKNVLVGATGYYGGSVDGKTDLEGKTSVGAEVHVSFVDKEEGGKLSFEAGGSLKNDPGGRLSAEGGVKVVVEGTF